MTFAPAPSAFLPLTNTLIAYLTGLLEQWIEYDLAGRVNPYRLCAGHGTYSIGCAELTLYLKVQQVPNPAGWRRRV